MATPQPRKLGFLDSFCLVVGTMIGTGVFLKAGIMSHAVGSPDFWLSPVLSRMPNDRDRKMKCRTVCGAWFKPNLTLVRFNESFRDVKTEPKARSIV